MTRRRRRTLTSASSTSIRTRLTRSTLSVKSRAGNPTLFSIALIAAVLWIAFTIQAAVNVRLVPRLRPDATASGPFLSAVVPARDEEAVIEATIAALLAQDYQPMEVVVVDDRSTDRTAAILERIAAEDPRLRVVRGSEPPEGWLGKPWALQQGVQASRGELLLFIDADVIYSPGAVSSVVDAWRESGAEMVTVFPRVEMRGFWENVLMPQLALMAFVFFPTWLSNRSRIVQLGLGGGPGNLIERSVYEEIGGHEALRDAVIDDIGMAWRVRRHRHRSIAVRGGEHLRLRMYRGFREIVDGFTKNVYTALGGTLPAALTSLTVMTLIHFAPFVLLARALWHAAAGKALDGTDLLGVTTVALITAARLIVFASLRYSLLSAIFAYPLSLPVWGWIVLRSTWSVGVLGRLNWRGRTYRSKSTRFGGG